MIDKKIIQQLVLEEINDQNILLPQNMDIDELVNNFIKFLEIDFYDWFKSNFNYFCNDVIFADKQ